jgi:hypothetical protein
MHTSQTTIIFYLLRRTQLAPRCGGSLNSGDQALGIAAV